jgi:hypothetical protein
VVLAGILHIETSHDAMAANAGMHRQHFVDKYSTLMKEVQRKMLDYVQDLLQDPSSIPAPNVNVTIPQTVVRKVRLELGTEKGFPLMPAMDGQEKMKKEELEDVLRQYLGAQYSKF